MLVFTVPNWNLKLLPSREKITEKNLGSRKDAKAQRRKIIAVPFPREEYLV